MVAKEFEQFRLTHRTIAECAASLGVSDSRVRQIVKSGALSTVSLAGRLYVPCVSLTQFVMNQNRRVGLSAGLYPTQEAA